MVWYGMVWKVQPSKVSSCRYRGLIYEVIREHYILHIYPICGIFYLPSIDIGTSGQQFNVSSE